mgnify:CR=1 FL=1
MALYPDDLLLYLAEVQTTGPRILKILKIFEEGSGLRINKSKSLLVPLRGDRGDEDWAEGISKKRISFKYLGVVIAIEPGLTWNQNIEPLTRHTRVSLRAWDKLPLNVLGRIALLKMMILPKYLYMMQNFPGWLPAEWFRTINALFRSFIWRNKLPRISFAKSLPIHL